MRMTVFAFLGALAISAACCLVAWAGGHKVDVATALAIPISGVVSGLVTGRAYWGLSEASFAEVDSR